MFILKWKKTSGIARHKQQLNMCPYTQNDKSLKRLNILRLLKHVIDKNSILLLFDLF